jgi:AcrR family transcriptional regulator
MENTSSPLRSVARGRPPTAGLRDKIVQAAERIFAENDFHEVLMDDVARACGVAKGTVYRYFTSKRALYLAVMFDGIELLRDKLRAAVESPEGPVRKLERVTHCILQHSWDRRFFFALIHRIEHKPEDPDAREWLRRRTEISRIIERAVTDGIAAGELEPVDPHLATEMLLGLLRGILRYRRAQDRFEDLDALIVRTFVAGIGTAGGRRRLGPPRKVAAL